MEQYQHEEIRQVATLSSFKQELCVEGPKVWKVSQSVGQNPGLPVHLSPDGSKLEPFQQLSEWPTEACRSDFHFWKSLLQAILRPTEGKSGSAAVHCYSSYPNTTCIFLVLLHSSIGIPRRGENSQRTCRTQPFDRNKYCYTPVTAENTVPLNHLQFLANQHTRITYRIFIILSST